MQTKELSDEALFLIENKILKITGSPDLEKLKRDLEAQINKELKLTIDRQEGNYIEATFRL